MTNTLSPARISTRLSLRWLPNPPCETTDTLVLNVGEWYVDLRVDKKSGQIDWALAGQYLQRSSNPRRIVFTHDIDSHQNFNVSEPCPFVALPNGDDLETGAMPCPDIPGEPVTEYEEVWRYLPAPEGPEGPGQSVSWMLESDDGVPGEGQHQFSKIFMSRIGGIFLILQQDIIYTRDRLSRGKWTVQVTGGEVSARREEWAGEQWEAKYVLGAKGDVLPSMAKELKELDHHSGLCPGDKVHLGGHPYIVRAFVSP